MKVLIFGATGMVGQGVLRECLLDASVAAVQTIGRSATGVNHTKLREVVHTDLFHYADIESGTRWIRRLLLLSRHLGRPSSARPNTSA